MIQSLYIKWVEEYFKGIVLKTVETLNGKNQGALPYFFKSMLRKEYSVTGKWESINTINTRVSADFVSMDSSLPLKRRDSLSGATGDIVKSGMELWLNEKQLTELDTMILQKVDKSDIIAKLFTDTPKVITGVYELMEKTFLEGLSTGYAVLDDTENVGTGIRLDYGYLTANKFPVTTVWSDPGSTPLTDIREVLKKAKSDGNVVRYVYMDDATFDDFAKTDEVKQYFAFSLNFLGSNVPAPTLDNINAALKKDSRYRFEIVIVDRTVINERNGVQTVVTPWEEGKVIFTSAPQVGALVWARLAEMNRPVAGVSYQTADDYILVSKFGQNRPSLAEFTNSQARAVPVIGNVESIYQIDAKLAGG